MALTPIDVQQKTFGTALRGYDLDEVDDFLDEVVTSLKDYEQRLRDAQERIATLEVEVTNRGDAEGAIARALVAAQRSADSIVAEARSEADQIRAGAQLEVADLVRASDVEKAEAEAEIERVRAVISDLRARLAGLGATVGGTLDEADAEISAAAVFLEPEESVEAAVAQAEEAQSQWDQPDDLQVVADPEDSADEDDEEDISYDDSPDASVESEDSLDDSVDAEDDSVDAEDGSDDEADDGLPDWATADIDDEDQPVRPWEVG
jgi:DivIVA domain-containing protein